MKELEELGRFKTLEMIEWQRRKESALDFKSMYFLQPAKPLRQLLILLLIKKSGKISQAKIAKEVGIVPAMVNNYIKEFRREGLLRIDSMPRPSYILTQKGEDKINELLFLYKNEIIRLYKGIREDFFKAISSFPAEGIKKVVLFGAGDVAELIYPRLVELKVEVLGIVDSNSLKWDTPFLSYKIDRPEKIKDYKPDAVLITSFAHKEEIKRQILELEKNGIKIKTIH